MSKHPAQTHWEDQVLRKVLQRSPETRPEFHTQSGLPSERLALPNEIDDTYLQQLGFPGQYPFTRGVQPTMYRGRLWTMRQYAGFSTAEESNRRYRYLLEQGTTGLSVAFDLPTQIGYDSDQPMSCGEVGKVGVAIDSLADMETLFAGIPLDKVSTSMTINATAPVLLALYVIVAEKQGVAPHLLTGTLQNDVLKEYVSRGTHIFPPRASLRLTTDIIAWSRANLPQFNPISISGYHIREAGANAIQEVAFTLANGIAYVEAAIQSGLKVDAFASRLAFFFNVSSDFLEEIAKFRAARRLWARIMKERFQAQDPASQMLRFHAQTSGHSLAAQQIDNNVVRVALQALAAVLGGTQSLHTNARDEALALPSEQAARLALRTQQIIAFESGVTQTVDPLAGSYFIEKLTDSLELEASSLIQRIDQMGGMVSAIESGFVQRQIEDSAYQFQQQVERKERIIVGVNRFQEPETDSPETLRLEAAVEESQKRRLADVRQKRDAQLVNSACARLEQAARGTDNIMPPLLEAMRAYATLGEVCGVLRRVFGEYR